MKTLTLNLVVYISVITFNLILKSNSLLEVVLQKTLACKQQNPVSIIGLTASICMLVIFMLRLESMLLCMQSQAGYRKKFNLKRATTVAFGTALIKAAP